LSALPGAERGGQVTDGIARAVLLVPHASGSLLILAVVFVRWIGASRSSELLGIGYLWTC
jgi:hypothetical protein